MNYFVYTGIHLFNVIAFLDYIRELTVYCPCKWS